MGQRKETDLGAKAEIYLMKCLDVNGTEEFLISTTDDKMALSIAQSQAKRHGGTLAYLFKCIWRCD